MPHRPETLAFNYAEPPVPGPLAGEIHRAVYAELKEEFLPEILAGRHGAEARFSVGTAQEGGRLAACCWTGAGRRQPECGVMAGVVTLAEHRGKGIATALVRGACERFESHGGRRLYLGVSNPVARRIYEKLGFRKVAGQILMRGEAGPESAPETGPVLSRPATAGDIGLVVPLYTQEHPAVLLDAGIRMPSPRVVPPWRCVRIFWDSWNSVRNGGRWHVLERRATSLVAQPPPAVSVAVVAQPPSAVSAAAVAQPPPAMLPSSSSVHRPSSPVPLVGSALARPEGGGFSVDFFWTPRYSTAGRAFVAQFLLDLAAPCEMLIAASDDWKQSEARRLGFRPVAGSEQWVEIQGQSFHLIRHRRD